MFQRPSLFILSFSTATTWFVGLQNPADWMLYFIATCWIVFGGYVLLKLIRRGHYWLAFFPVLFIVVIGVGVSLPVETFDQMMEPFNRHLREHHSPLLAGKIGHILCFSMLTFVCLSVRKNLQISLADLFVTVALLGLATEGIQLFIAGRTPQLLDFGFDLIGILIAAATYFGWIKLCAIPPGKTRVLDAANRERNQSPTEITMRKSS